MIKYSDYSKGCKTMIKYPESYDSAKELMYLYNLFEEFIKEKADKLGYYQNEDIMNILTNENYHTLNNILDW